MALGITAIALALAHFASRMRWVEYGYRAAAPRAQGQSRNRGPEDDRADDRVARSEWRGPLGARLRGGL